MNEAAPHDADQPTQGWLKALNDPASVILYLDEARTVPLILRPIPPTRGQFWMGSRDPTMDNFVTSYFSPPVTRVEIKEPFWMGAFPITQQQWRSVLEACSETALRISPSEFFGAYRPVEFLSWDDCQAWLISLNTLPWVKEQLDALSKTYSKPTGQLQLPTGAHWEWSCRASPYNGPTGDATHRTSRSDYHAGDGERALRECGWYAANSGGETQAVGRLHSNVLGLYDLHGNVFEWCSDSLGEFHRQGWDGITVAELDAVKEIPAEVYMMRGGSFIYPAGECRSLDRFWWWGNVPGRALGFRACLFSGPTQTQDRESEPGDKVRCQAETESQRSNDTSVTRPLIPP